MLVFVLVVLGVVHGHTCLAYNFKNTLVGLLCACVPITVEIKSADTPSHPKIKRTLDNYIEFGGGARNMMMKYLTYLYLLLRNLGIWKTPQMGR